MRNVHKDILFNINGFNEIIAMNLSPKDLNKKLKHMRQYSFLWF